LEQLRKLYVDFRKIYASGEVSDTQLRKYCCETYARKIRNELNTRPKNSNITVDLEVKDTKIKFLNLQVIVLPPPISSTFIQITTQVTSRQEITLKDNKNDKSLSQSSFVADFVVFERLLTSQEIDWKIVDTIKRPETFQIQNKK